MTTIDARMVQKCFLSGAKRIEANKEYINELNVFPVPDGDTGTNMTMTIMSAANDVNALVNPSMEQLCKAISSGSLTGARGNSGVILSQLLRGFTKEMKNFQEASVTVIAAAFERAVETAYNAVMKPKEGTILTVARGGAECAKKLAEEGEEDILVFAEKIVKHMEEVLAITPELLPVLKEAGVVDSGGKGLLTVMEGVLDTLNGKETDFSLPVNGSPVVKRAGGAANDSISTADIKFGYCTEFIVMVEKHYDAGEELNFKAYLESIGDSIVVVSDDGIIKVHVHTNDPGLAIQKALTYGSLSRMKIDNMREEHNERVIQGASEIASKEQEKPKAPRKPIGFVAVSIGEGLNEIFRGVGVDYIIEGGQTMNPSTEDMLEAIDEVNADTVYILPNNSNIILAAEQAKSLISDREIIVIPSKTVPQGITAMINFMPDKSVAENTAHMTEEMKKVKTGQVTYAVRDTSMDGKEIKAGDIMGIGDKTILSVGDNISEVTFELINQLVFDDAELISLYFGADVTEADAEALAERMEDSFPDMDVEVHAGGQPIYYYVVSVE